MSYLADMGVEPRSYSIGEPAADADNVWCLVPEGQQWTVFFYERGSRWDAESFASDPIPRVVG